MFHTRGIPNATEGPITTQLSSVIGMYEGDERVGQPDIYSDPHYRFAAAHELGHILGLDDARSGWGTLDSIMSPGHQCGFTNAYSTVTRFDVEALIRAYATNRIQNIVR